MNLSIHEPEIQDKILLGMISEVTTYGWTTECLEQAVVNLGFTKQEAKRAFQGNLDNALNHFMTMIDRQMAETLENVDLMTYRVRDRIVFLILLRLKLMAPYCPFLTKALKHQFVSGSFKYLNYRFLTTIDNLWYTAGDQATDFNYYSKRFLLSGVYAATFLFWLRDLSADFIKTQDFLENRIDQVMKLSSWIRRFKS